MQPTKISDTQYSVPQDPIVIDISLLIPRRTMLWNQIQEYTAQLADMDAKIAAADSVGVKTATDFLATNPETMQAVPVTATLVPTPPVQQITP